MGQAIVFDHPDAKRIENRTRSLPKTMLGVETVVAVHCGKKWSARYAHMVIDTLPAADWNGAGELGCIIGAMKLSGRQFTTFGDAYYGLSGRQAERWYDGPYGYEILDAIALPRPIPCRGMLGFWTL